jgi:hypothetical protein
MHVGLVFNRAAQFALTIFSKTRLQWYWVKRLQLATMLYVMDALEELGDLHVMKLDLPMPSALWASISLPIASLRASSWAISRNSL